MCLCWIVPWLDQRTDNNWQYPHTPVSSLRWAPGRRNTRLRLRLWHGQRWVTSHKVATKWFLPPTKIKREENSQPPNTNFKISVRWLVQFFLNWPTLKVNCLSLPKQMDFRVSWSLQTVRMMIICLIRKRMYMLIPLIAHMSSIYDDLLWSYWPSYQPPNQPPYWSPYQPPYRPPYQASYK